MYPGSNYWGLLEAHDSVIKGQPWLHQVCQKLDGVAPLITSPPQTSFTTLSKKTTKSDIWHVKCDMWHMVCDTYHVTRNIWHVGGGEPSLSCLALMVWDLWYFEDWEEPSSLSAKAIAQTENVIKIYFFGPVGFHT